MPDTPDISPIEAKPRLPPVVLVVLLVLAFLAVFGPVLGYPLVWDDKFLVRDNYYLSSLNGLWVALRSDFWAVAGGDGPSGMYRPVVTLTHFVERTLAGPSPVAAHATNLLVHLSNAILLGWFLSRIESTKRIAFVAAALFAFHPVMVEPVANVSARTDPLVAIFLLLAAHVRLGPTRWRNEGLAGLAIFLALLAKEQALVAIPLFLLLDLVTRPSDGWRIRTARAAGPVGATIAYFALRIVVLGSMFPPGAHGLFGVRPWRPWDGPAVTAWYAIHALLPTELGPSMVSLSWGWRWGARP
jgi:hypothetical protein